MADPFTRPPIASAALSVVLVTRNSGDQLDDVLAAWQEFLNNLEQEFELIIVNDGSTDDTAARLAEYSNIKIFHHETPQGFGAALRTGIAEAQHPLLCYCIADRQYDPSELSKLLQEIDQVDMVTGYRQWQDVPGWYRFVESVFRGFLYIVFGIHKEPLPCWLDRQSAVLRRRAYWIYGLPLHDPACAFRLFRRELFARIPIQSDSAFAHVEILAKANFLGALLSEVPLTWHPPENEAAFNLDKSSGQEMRRVFSRPDFGPVEIETWGDTCLSKELRTVDKPEVEAVGETE